MVILHTLKINRYMFYVMRMILIYVNELVKQEEREAFNLNSWEKVTSSQERQLIFVLWKNALLQDQGKEGCVW